MSHRSPSLKSLEVFVSAGQLLSFGRAAAALGLSPSAVSRRIRELETELETALFERRSKSVALTDAGAQYLAALAPAFGAIRRATDDLAAARTRLVITAPQSFAVSWLTPRLASFRERHPGIDIEVDVSSDITGRFAGDVDIGIFLGEGPWPEHHAERLLPIAIFPVCSPKLAETLHTPADLMQTPLLHVRQLPNAWREWLDAAPGGRAVAAARPGTRDMIFNDVNLAFEAAQRGLGVAMGADVVVDEHLRAGRLAAPFAFKAASAFSYHFVCARSRRRHPSVRTFHAWIKRCIAEPEMR